MSATPALCALVMKNHQPHPEAKFLTRCKRWQLRAIAGFDRRPRLLLALLIVSGVAGIVLLRSDRPPAPVLHGAGIHHGFAIACLAVFFAHHSIMARARAKRAIARVIPPAIERSTYVLVATLAMLPADKRRMTRS